MPTFQPRSILKPTIPLTPPKNIPSFDELRQKSTAKAKSPAKSVPEDLLIDFSTPAPSREVENAGNVPAMGALLDPFSPVRPQNSDTAASRNDSENEVIQHTDEEDQKRQAEKKAILERRDARRKSLANRRVSFAPEATLHTWSVMELVEDSTTSSASNSTRRQSAMTAAQSPMPRVDTLGGSSEDERPSTPVEQASEEVVKETPESQRELHQRKRRRTSDSMHSSDDEAFSSPGDGADSSPIRVEESIDSESDTDGDTAMSLDEATANSIRSSNSSSTQTSLDERLRQAASQAGTKGIKYDENGTDDDGDDEEQSMEIADGTVTHAFRQYAPKAHSSQNMPTGFDKENVNPFQDTPQTTSHDELEEEDPTTGMTMEMTRAVGGIVSNGIPEQSKLASVRRRSNISRRSSSGGETSIGDETMDLTVAKGGIVRNDEDLDADESASDEDMTMEMTGVVGGVANGARNGPWQREIMEETEAMDMTMAAGGILPPIEEQTEPQTDIEDNVTGAMDITQAVGKIFKKQTSNTHDEDTLSVLKQEPTPSSQLDHELSQAIPMSATTTRQMATVASETGSPTLKPRLSGRRAATNSRSSTPKSISRTSVTETNEQNTPSKQLTPAPMKSTSPKRTPVLAGVTQRGASPKKLFAKEIQQRASPAGRKSPRRQQDLLFSKDETTGLHTPRVVLHAPKPHQHLRRRSNGIGIDNEISGSPRVSEILSRRSSIGDVVPEFQLAGGQKRQLRFENPQEIEREVELERAEEHRRESGRFIMEQEADEQHEENTTQNLKEMIESMTPKKEKSVKHKGRKSLAVGSARGLLGKRPAELEIEDDEDDGESTPKRLKTVSREASPVKKVHLPKPPTKEETTGRLLKAEQLQLAAMAPASSTPTLSQSPIKKIKSPERTGRFREPAEQKASSFETKLDNVVGATDVATIHPELAKPDAEEEKISLQQFLNMTNIHFIELSTTKRRHTMAQAPADTVTGDAADDSSRASFVAAATTLPLLELYQHATRELKSYISSGRKIIRTIEAETLAEQPPIFREYLDARPDIKTVMDNQFRNGKTNARLQSKEGWYSWRSQLVDGLQSGLQGIQSDMEKDKQTLTEQQKSLDGVLPGLVSKKERLQQQLQDLRRRLHDFESNNHEALMSKRRQLVDIDREVLRRSDVVNELQQQMQEKDEVLSQAAELRQEMNDQINEALRVQEEQRRWPAKDVASLKQRVDELEQKAGWKLLTAEEDTDEPSEFGVALTMRYQNELRLFFYPTAFQPKSDTGRRRSGRNSRSVSGPSVPISLVYSPDEDDGEKPKTLSNELRFFLQLLQSQLHGYAMMPKGSTTCQQVLKTVSEGWSLAQKVTNEICQLNSAGIVRVSIQGDEKLGAKLMLMQPDRSRVDIDFTLTVLPLNDGEYSVTTSVTATPIYGPATHVMDASKIRKIQHALSKEVESKSLGQGSWVSAIQGFEEWLQAQTKAKEEEEALKPKPTSRKKVELNSQSHAKTHEQAEGQARRAATQSPRGSKETTSTTPTAPARSPLAPKATNRIQKKTIPVPKKANQLLQPLGMAQELREASQQKENLMPIGVGAKVFNGGEMNGLNGFNEDDVFGGAKPAITPEMQEAMMHTPVKKRVGALRRSPV